MGPEYVQRFATKEAADAAAGGKGNDEEEEEEEDAEMSDIGSLEEDENPASSMDI